MTAGRSGCSAATASSRPCSVCGTHAGWRASSAARAASTSNAMVQPARSGSSRCAAAARRTASASASALAALLTCPSAPALRASSARSSLGIPETSSTAAAGSVARMCSRTSSECSGWGSRRSRITTSGCASPTAAIASSALRTAPTTPMSSCAPSQAAASVPKPRESSAMKTRSTLACRARRRLVLRAPDAEPGIGERRRVDDDLREPHDRDDVLHRHLLAVDLLEEVDHLLVAAELGVVVLDVAGRQVADALDLDLVDDRVEDLLARRVLVPDGHHHRLVLLVLVRLVAQADRRRLATPLELVGEDRGVEVQHLHPTAETTRRRRSATGRGRPCAARPRR